MSSGRGKELPPSPAESEAFVPSGSTVANGEQRPAHYASIEAALA